MFPTGLAPAMWQLLVSALAFVPPLLLWLVGIPITSVALPAPLKHLLLKFTSSSARLHRRHSCSAAQPSAHHVGQPALLKVLGLDFSGFPTPQLAISSFFQQQLRLKFVPPLVTSQPWRSAGGRSALYVAGPPSLIRHVLRVKGRHLGRHSPVSIHPCATWPEAPPADVPPFHHPQQQPPAAAGGTQLASPAAAPAAPQAQPPAAASGMPLASPPAGLATMSLPPRRRRRLTSTSEASRSVLKGAELEGIG